MTPKTASRDSGLSRYRAQQRREAIARVRAFQRWRRAGFGKRHVPDKLPSANDFKIARSAGVLK